VSETGLQISPLERSEKISFISETSQF